MYLVRLVDGFGLNIVGAKMEIASRAVVGRFHCSTPVACCRPCRAALIFSQDMRNTHLRQAHILERKSSRVKGGAQHPPLSDSRAPSGEKCRWQISPEKHFSEIDQRFDEDL